jgi:hypothetical protein
VIPVVIGLVLLLAAVGLVVFLWLRGSPSEDEPPETIPGTPVEVTEVSPAVPISPLPAPSCETIISSGDVQVAVALPTSLSVSGASFPVVAIVPEADGWTYPSGYPGSVAWVCGTVVNYVVGLEPTAENEALLAGVIPGDEIKLQLSNGVEMIFHFAERREVPANESGVFAQVRPRLTLVLEQDAGTWQVATADYVAETEPVDPSSGVTARVGETVRVGDAQITVARGHAKRGGQGLFPGTMYYLVEFSVANVGAAPLDSGAFDTQLQDTVGNVYLLSSAAGAAGEYGPLTGEIAPGATAQGTAGYVVPETLSGPSVVWSFAPQPGVQQRASVTIPYDPGSAPAPAVESRVAVTDAFLSPDGDLLILEGEVQNVGGQPLDVRLSDISLSSSAGVSELRLAAPPLPWTVEPGQTQVIELQYAKPQASAALLSLLGFSFEINGL